MLEQRELNAVREELFNEARLFFLLSSLEPLSLAPLGQLWNLD